MAAKSAKMAAKYRRKLGEAENRNESRSEAKMAKSKANGENRLAKAISVVAKCA